MPAPSSAGSRGSEATQGTTALIIGGGVTGAAIARELTKYHVKVTLVEKESDLARGASGACGGVIHSGFDPEPGTLKAALNVRGNRLYGRLASELGFKFRRTGTLILCLSAEDLPRLDEIRTRGAANGVTLETWPKERVLNLEPNSNPDVVEAVFAPDAGIVFPVEVTLALAASALRNGARVLLDTAVDGIVAGDGRVKGVATSRGFMPADIVINAAGVDAAVIAGTAGDHSFSVRPRRGQQVILDKQYGRFVTRHLMTLPTKMGKGIGVAPTTGGNIHLGSTAEDGVDPHDTRTTDDGLEWIFANARRLTPGVERSWMIASFAGIRAVADTGDFVIRESPEVRGLFHAAGIQSPGLSAAPAIAEHMLRIMARSGIDLEPRGDFEPSLERPVVTAALSLEEWSELAGRDPSFGKIVCRCEGVTEGEIVASIRTPLGARTIDGVKKRTRAGMGRCQGGFCGHRVAAILARELGVSIWEVEARGAGSKLGVGPAKCCFGDGVAAG